MREPGAGGGLCCVSPAEAVRTDVPGGRVGRGGGCAVVGGRPRDLKAVRTRSSFGLHGGGAGKLEGGDPEAIFRRFKSE